VLRRDDRLPPNWARYFTSRARSVTTIEQRASLEKRADTMTEHAAVTPHAIRRRAYERWLERGSPQGSPEQDWLEAERELLADAVRAESRTPASAVPAAPLPSSGVPRRRAPRSIVTSAATAPAARLLAALVPQVELGAEPLRAARGRR
jgi:DUF2934 family protein